MGQAHQGKQDGPIARPAAATPTTTHQLEADEQRQAHAADMTDEQKQQLAAAQQQQQQQTEAAHSLDLLPFEAQRGAEDGDLLDADLHHASSSSHAADLPSRYSTSGAAVWPLDDVLMHHEHE